MKPKTERVKLNTTRFQSIPHLGKTCSTTPETPPMDPSRSPGDPRKRPRTALQGPPRLPPPRCLCPGHPAPCAAPGRPASTAAGELVPDPCPGRQVSTIPGLVGSAPAPQTPVSGPDCRHSSFFAGNVVFLFLLPSSDLRQGRVGKTSPWRKTCSLSAPRSSQTGFELAAAPHCKTSSSSSSGHMRGRGLALIFGHIPLESLFCDPGATRGAFVG